MRRCLHLQLQRNFADALLMPWNGCRLGIQLMEKKASRPRPPHDEPSSNCDLLDGLDSGHAPAARTPSFVFAEIDEMSELQSNGVELKAWSLVDATRGRQVSPRQGLLEQQGQVDESFQTRPFRSHILLF